MIDFRRVRLLAFSIAILLGLPACGGPQLRTARTVSPEDIQRVCAVAPGAEITRGDAICIATLAGLNLDASALTVTQSGELGGGPTWVVEEICDERNPRCIGVSIRRSDGTIADTRYLYLFSKRHSSN